MKSYWNWKTICICTVICVIAGVIIGTVLKAHGFAWNPDMGWYKFVKIDEGCIGQAVRFIVPCENLTHLNVLDIIRMW